MQAAPLPPHLLKCLRSANIRDSDPDDVQGKLNERTTSNIVSYLQLGFLKLQHSALAAQAVEQQIAAHLDRTAYAAVLQQRTAALRRDDRA